MHVIVIIATVLFIAGCIIGWGGFFLSFFIPNKPYFDKNRVVTYCEIEKARHVRDKIVSVGETLMLAGTIATIVSVAFGFV